MNPDEIGTDDDAADSSPDFKPARFTVELGLPTADESFFQDAKVAVRQEYRGCSKWKRLRCHKISVLSERGHGTVYAIHVGSSVDFDWTWEGAVAFRPHALGEDGAIGVEYCCATDHMQLASCLRESFHECRSDATRM